MQSDELKRRFGRKIQALREAKGLTQEQLASKIGRSVDTVSNIERGINATRIETANRLATELDVDLPLLFELDELRAAAPPTSAALADIARLLENRDAETIKTIRDLVETSLRLVGGK